MRRAKQGKLLDSAEYKILIDTRASIFSMSKIHYIRGNLYTHYQSIFLKLEYVATEWTMCRCIIRISSDNLNSVS